ncbi:MAG: hypothetical protein NC090_05785 [Anaeroplasma bactoclasticum]|nr:hypothetical protein [Anaeroplasma bactoclasticum]MCM1514481.1 hypothetical protein [Anaeroplasma bactoclasticum]
MQSDNKLIDTLETMNCILFDIKAELEAANSYQRQQNKTLSEIKDQLEEDNSKINIL